MGLAMVVSRVEGGGGTGGVIGTVLLFSQGSETDSPAWREGGNVSACLTTWQSHFCHASCAAHVPCCLLQIEADLPPSEPVKSPNPPVTALLISTSNSPSDIPRYYYYCSVAMASWAMMACALADRPAKMISGNMLALARGIRDNSRCTAAVGIARWA